MTDRHSGQEGDYVGLLKGTDQGSDVILYSLQLLPVWASPAPAFFLFSSVSHKLKAPKLALAPAPSFVSLANVEHVPKQFNVHLFSQITA